MNQYFSNEAGIVLSLYYKHDDLFTSLQKESSLRLRSIVEKPEEFDRFRMTTEDRSWYDENNQLSTDAIYEYLQSYCKQFSEGYKADTELYDDDGVTIGMHVLYNMNLGPSYDINTTSLLDDKIGRALKAHILSYWFMKNNKPDLQESFSNECNGYLDEVRRTLIRRVKGVRRNVNWL
jgi:hypothetical protein